MLLKAGTWESLQKKPIIKELKCLFHTGVPLMKIITAYQAGTTTPVALPILTTPPQSDISVAWSHLILPGILNRSIPRNGLHLFPDGWEAWAENRRTGFPKLYPIIDSDNPDVPADELMRRVQYPTVEYNMNGYCRRYAISKLGGPDKSKTRLRVECC